MKVCSLCQRCYDDEAVLCMEEGHPALPEPRDRDRQCVAGYRLEYLLKSGQHWETYRAVEAESGRPCLIRIILPNARNGEQFLGEATLAATLFNPCFADVYDAGTMDDGGFFAVTEETEGKTVRQMLNTSGPPKLLTTVEIIRQTAEALHSLHAGGLVHRAIRPENIVLAPDTDNSLSVRLQSPDFGGAIERSIVSNKFLIDTALDSLRYYAPEQFTGEPATPQTDLYSLGIVLFEMLAGVPPFDAPKATALIAKHKSQSPPELRIADFNLRMLLTHTLKESLHKQARLRQSSANAFARQLRHIEQLATHVSTPPPAGTVPAPTSERPVVIAPAQTPAQFLITQRPLALSEAERPVTQIVQQPFADLRETVVPFDVEIDSGPVLSRSAPEKFENYPQQVMVDHAGKLNAEEEPFQGPDQLSDELGRNDPAGNNLDRTRLKFRKRRMRSKIIRVVNAIADNGPVAPRNAEVLRSDPVEASLQCEPNTSGIKLPDRNAVEAALKEALAARSAKPVKKIELRLSGDDIPTDTDALQSAAIDQAVDLIRIASPKPTVEMTPVTKAPKHIEWQQPEDDIPSEADVLEVMATEEVLATSAVDGPVSIGFATIALDKPFAAAIEAEPIPETGYIESSLQVTVPTPAAPGPVEAPRPAPAVPIQAAAMGRELLLAEPRSQDVSARAPLVKAAVVSGLPVVTQSPKRTKIEFDVSTNDIEKRDAIIEVRASEDPERSPVVEHDQDEITLVAPPSRRIRIDVKQPGRWKATPPTGYGDTFVPTILGESAVEAPAPLPDADHRDPILSVYYGAADPNRRSPYRSLVMGAGFLGSVVLLLFGNVLVREEARTEAAANTVASKTFPPQSSPPQSSKTALASPGKDKPLKAVEKPAEEPDAAKGERANPITNKEQTKATGARSEPQNRPTKSASVKPLNEKPRVVPSTIVISSDNGKVKSKVEPQEKQAARPSPTPNKKSPGTRPRIVMVP